MSRHYWWARAREGGFTFVELLVTIIIAGIAFAALVPVFLGAQDAAAGEQVRNSALGLAQDKLEKVRGLDYDVITQDALTNDTIPDAQFGTTVAWATGGGATRDYTVAYRVDLLPEGSADGAESYKQVTITVSWTGNPKPISPVVLSTMVSKQYAGPQITRFDVGPDTVMRQDPMTGGWSIVAGPVVLDAYIASEDILSMNQSAALDEEKGYVEFTVTPVNGTSVATAKVTVPVGASGPEQAHYTFEWDNSEAGDGVYIFQAVAVSGFGSRAEGMPVSRALKYENHAPPAPTNLEVDTVGDKTVGLSWVRPAAADVQHYQVWRSSDGVNFSKIADNVPSEGYTDATGLVNGNVYYYKVRAVDSEGFAGAASNIVTATPVIPGDTTAPSVPSPMTAVADAGAATVHLAWAASSDPESGLSGYTIERSLDNVNWTVIQSGYDDVFYDDTAAGWSTTWRYRVKAVNNVAIESAYATAGPVTTIPEILRSITVTNNSSADVYVWLENAVLGTWLYIDGTSSATRPASGERVRKNNKSATWSNLHSGIYNVYIHSGSSSSSTLLKTQAVTATAGDGTASYP